MIRQVFLVGALVVSTSAVSIKNLQKRVHQKSPLEVGEIPSSFLEAGYSDEEFPVWGDKQESSLIQLNAPVRQRAAQVITKFHEVAFYDHGYKFEPQYEDSSPSSLLETSTNVEHPTLPQGGDFHKDHKFTIGFAPESYAEALYWDSPATSFFQVSEQAEAKAEVHNVLQPVDIPESFIEAGYDGERFFPKDPTEGDFHRDHPYQIGFAPETYREALYWDSPASSFFEMDAEPEEGEDFRISKHGRTEDVNDPDFEINHPTPHKHTKNVIGTKQEGHLFWTDTRQPNPDTYESTFDEKVRTEHTVEADDQAFSVEDEAQVENNAKQLDCPGCDTTPHGQY